LKELFYEPTRYEKSTALSRTNTD